jgi:hypothetical protein
MQKHHSAQRYLLVQYLAWFNIWRRYGIDEGRGDQRGWPLHLVKVECTRSRERKQIRFLPNSCQFSVLCYGLWCAVSCDMSTLTLLLDWAGIGDEQ